MYLKYGKHPLVDISKQRTFIIGPVPCHTEIRTLLNTLYVEQMQYGLMIISILEILQIRTFVMKRFKHLDKKNLNIYFRFHNITFSNESDSMLFKNLLLKTCYEKCNFRRITPTASSLPSSYKNTTENIRRHI